MFQEDKRSFGFTLVEIMVAMVVLAISLLGLVALVNLVIGGKDKASDLTSATNICQLKIEELKDVDFVDLGNRQVTDADVKKFGADDGAMVREEGLNSQGKTVAYLTSVESLSQGEALAQGPFKFMRTFVICRSDDYETNGNYPHWSGTPAQPGSGENRAAPDCKVNPTDETTRVKALVCDSSDIALGYGSENEKKIKVLCSWRDRKGQCSSVHLATTVVDIN